MFDSVAMANQALSMLRCAEDLRRIADGPVDGGDAVRQKILDAADMLEANLPINGLTTLGVVNFGLDPIDVAWLLQQHIAGKHDGFTGNDPELRDRFLQRHSVVRSDTFPPPGQRFNPSEPG